MELPVQATERPVRGMEHLVQVMEHQAQGMEHQVQVTEHPVQVMFISLRSQKETLFEYQFSTNVARFAHFERALKFNFQQM